MQIIDADDDTPISQAVSLPNRLLIIKGGGIWQIQLADARNAVEHPKPGQDVILHDYRLKSDGLIHRPTIEVIHQRSPVGESDLLMFVEAMAKFILEAYELLLVHLCGLHAKSRGVFELRISILPEEQRRNKHVKFAFLTKLGGRWIPLS